MSIYSDEERSIMPILDIEDKEDPNWYYKLPNYYKDKLHNKTIYALDKNEQKLLEHAKKGDITLKTFLNYYLWRKHYQINDDLTISRKSSLLVMIFGKETIIFVSILLLCIIIPGTILMITQGVTISLSQSADALPVPQTSWDVLYAGFQYLTCVSYIIVFTLIIFNIILYMMQILYNHFS